MSMSIDIGEDAGELEEDDLEREDDFDEDDPDDGGGRASRGNDRRRSKAKADDDDDEPDDDDEDLTPEELRAELKKTRAALARTGKQTLRQRNARKELAKRVRELEGKSDDDEPDDDGEDDTPTAKSIQKTVSRAVRERERQLQDEHRRDLINTRAETALARAGVSDRNVRLLLKELDVEEIDFDAKTRSIDGLDEEIDRLKDEFPDLFRRRRDTQRRINGGDNRDTSAKRKRPMTTSEIQAAQLRGR